MIRVRPIAVIAATLGLSLMSGVAYAQTAPAVPGADESAAVTAETQAELIPPTAPARLAEIKVKGAAAIAVRLTRISVLGARVAAVKGDCGDITALQAQLSTDTAGLTALNTTLAAETDITRPELNTDRSISVSASSPCRAPRRMWWCDAVPALLGSSGYVLMRQPSNSRSPTPPPLAVMRLPPRRWSPVPPPSSLPQGPWARPPATP